MIVVKNITKTFGTHKAVDNVSFTVNEGENIVFLGTSGCGKTTLLKMINRLLDPDSGEIWINGHRIVDQRPEDLRKKIGYVFQNTGLFPHYTIEENIGTVPRLLGWDKAKIAARVSDLLEELHLSPDQYRSAYPHQLSGGQQQRVGIARALAAYPPVLLMDEPFGALDPLTRAEMQDMLRDLLQRLHKTVLLVTHDLDEALYLASHLVLLEGGKVVANLPAGEFLHSQVPAVQAYVRAVHRGQEAVN